MKTCKEISCKNNVWARGLCLHHDKIKSPERYFIKPRKSNISNDNVKVGVTITKPRKPLKRGYVKPISDKQRGRLERYKKLRDPYMEEHPVCEAKLDDCTYNSTELHHLSGRVGNNLFKDFMAVCQFCHHQIEVMGEEVYELGFKCYRV